MESGTLMHHHLRKYLNKNVRGKYSFVIIKKMVIIQFGYPNRNSNEMWLKMRKELAIYYNVVLVLTTAIHHYEGKKYGRRPPKNNEQLF
jgi:hypothetical protein